MLTRWVIPVEIIQRYSRLLLDQKNVTVGIGRQRAMYAGKSQIKHYPEYTQTRFKVCT